MLKELFLVEGVSAASTVRQAMHKPSQTVLALQGKLINCEKAKPSAVIKNVVCQKIIRTLDCGFADDVQTDNLPFSKIILLSDPDIDGMHARLLLMRFFEKYFASLISAGLVYLVTPPLFRLTSSDGDDFLYAWSESQRDELQQQHNHALTVSRIKGIAQFSLAECNNMLLSPATRHQVQLQLSVNT